jgi:hypothetical protein
VDERPPLAWTVLAAGSNVPDPATLIESPGEAIIPPFGETAVFAVARSNE